MSRLYRNIKAVCKENGIKISQAESPYKAGFISRYEARDAIMELPLFMVYHIAKNCGVSIEDLIEKDLSTEYQLAVIRNEIEHLKEKELELIEQTDCPWK